MWTTNSNKTAEQQKPCINAILYLNVFKYLITARIFIQKSCFSLKCCCISKVLFTYGLSSCLIYVQASNSSLLLFGSQSSHSYQSGQDMLLCFLSIAYLALSKIQQALSYQSCSGRFALAASEVYPLGDLKGEACEFLPLQRQCTIRVPVKVSFRCQYRKQSIIEVLIFQHLIVP